MVIGYTAAACEMGRCGIAEKENVRKNILFRIFGENGCPRCGKNTENRDKKNKA